MIIFFGRWIAVFGGCSTLDPRASRHRSDPAQDAVGRTGWAGRTAVSSPVSSGSVEDRLQGAVFGGVVGNVVLPAAPADVEPGAGEDADGVGVVVAAGSGPLVEVRGPGVGVVAAGSANGSGRSVLRAAIPGAAGRARRGR